jgi:hypothetical protein
MKPGLMLLIGACATAPVAAPHVVLREVTKEEQVEQCRPIGRFEAESALPGEDGMKQAREEARAKAAAAGANTIMVARDWQSPDVASSAVRAYDCK